MGNSTILYFVDATLDRGSHCKLYMTRRIWVVLFSLGRCSCFLFSCVRNRSVGEYFNIVFYHVSCLSEINKERNIYLSFRCVMELLQEYICCHYHLSKLILFKRI